jgi:uncharacterized protein
MSTHIGTPAQGKNFFGRSKMIEKLMKVILLGSHILLSGPRRVGKTSLAMRILFLLRKKSWNGIYVTFEGAKDETVIAQRIITALKEQEPFWKKSQSIFDKIFKGANIELEAFGAKVRYNKNNNDVANMLETLGRAINSLSGNFLVIIDELPVFLASLESKEDGKARVEAVLNVLRSFRQNDAGDDDDNVEKKVWFFCGSISLESYAAHRNLSYTINDIRPFKLGAYETAEAVEYLNMARIKSEVVMKEEVRDYLLKKVGWPIPFYLAIVFEAALNEMDDTNIMEYHHINVGYEKSLEEYQKDFDLWIQRLKLHIVNSEIHIEFLKLIATSQNVNLSFLKAFIINSEWSNLKELQLIAVLDQLEADGYIVLEEYKYVYRSPLIKDYIIKKFHLDHE